MGEAEDRYQAMKARLLDAGNKRSEQMVAHAKDQAKALYDLANDLTYPMDREGNQMNIHWLIPMLSDHLARLGYRKDESKAEIMQIPHPRRGHAQVAEDAVLYVPVDARGVIPGAFVPTPEEEPVDPMNDRWVTKTHITVDGETIKGGP